MRLTIGQLAERAGVPISTVRYYERIGLVPDPDRGANGHRVYGEPELERLRYIRAALDSGFTLDDLPRLHRGDPDEMMQILGVRLARVEQELARLIYAQETLARLQQQCGRCDCPEGKCRVPQEIRPVS